MSVTDALLAHLESGDTTVCRCWLLQRKDGTALGFTDHDRDVEFGGHHFMAETGMSAGTLAQTTGLAVDNTEAVGALSDGAITEEDIEAGRYDGAGVTAWLVNWVNPQQNMVIFRGTLGELRRAGGEFHAELRGLTEALNQPQGRVYQAQCSAVVGDAECAVALEFPGYNGIGTIAEVDDRKLFRITSFGPFAPGRFERGKFVVLDGAAADLTGLIKTDRVEGIDRVVELWQSIGAAVAPGDRVQLFAGCDKRAETCRSKFNNFLNFRGFPHIPGEDWLMSYPVSGSDMDGGSLNS